MTTTLITGATGTVGNQVARALLEKGGMSVRVGTRRPEAAEDLKELGAEVVRLDLDEPGTLGAAFAGVDRLFLVGPQSSEDFGERTSKVIAAAKDAGVSHLLRLSAAGASPDGDFVLAVQHGLAEEHVANSGIAWTVLRPTFFQDNVINFQGEAIRSSGAFYGASGAGKVSYVSSADIAAVAAAILADPEAHTGKTYALTGGQSITDTELAAMLSELLGTEVRYVDVGGEALAASMRERGMPGWIADSLAALEAVKANGWAAEVSPAVEEITGRAPERYRAFLERNRARFS